MAKLIEKTTLQLVSALEDYLYFLARSLRDLSEGDAGQMRQVSTQLRSLVCKSAGLPALLWRLCDQLNVDDTVSIRYPGNVNVNTPLARGLLYFSFTARVDGSGPPEIPLAAFSFREHIQKHEAFFIDGESISHEYLINRLANETGVAHEADGVSKSIAKLNSFLTGNIQTYFPVLYSDARLTLEVGEKVISKAVEQGYVRRRPTAQDDIPSNIATTEFSFKPDVPVLPLRSNQGTMAFSIPRPKLPESGRLDREWHSAPFTQGTVHIKVKISRRGKLHVSTEGLPLPYFSFECSLLGPSANDIRIVITWDRSIVKAFVDGRQVAGPRATEACGVAP